jgi:transglutaminase/protease-like cytokinesis protein 3
VTISRSSRDPYTPPERARWLETIVLEEIHKLYFTKDSNSKIDNPIAKRQCLESQNCSDERKSAMSHGIPFFDEMQPSNFHYNATMFGSYTSDDAVLFNTPSHLLSDFGEIWASTDGIELEYKCSRWSFSEGMLFGSMMK